MHITVFIKSVYGNDLIYPACPKAQTFAELIGKKTFSLSDLAKIRTLGFEVVEGENPKKGKL
jgi:hypothetical protein